MDIVSSQELQIIGDKRTFREIIIKKKYNILDWFKFDLKNHLFQLDSALFNGFTSFKYIKCKFKHFQHK